MTTSARSYVDIFGFPIDKLTWELAVAQIISWSANKESRYICICNTHSLVTAQDDPDFAAALNASDLNTADGAPVAWLMRALGAKRQQRINGPDLMWQVCGSLNQYAAASVFFYGNTDKTCEELSSRLQQTFPKLKIAGHYSPPFRQLTEPELDNVVRAINDSGAGVVWVSLGCPKQEKWMHAQKGKIHAVMIGVGAAFDYHAGTIRRAPKFFRDIGLEWLFRLASEPGRLWRRYLYSNTRYLVLAARRLISRSS